MKNNCNSIKSVIFQMSLILSIILFIMSPAQYVHAGDDVVILGCFITLRGEITCSDTGKAPEQTKISVFDANSNTTLVKEVIIHGGTYELNLDPGVYQIHYASEGYSTYISEDISISRESVYVKDVVLQKETAVPAKVVFTVTDENSVPFSNCVVSLQRYVDNHFQFCHGVTDENGRFVIGFELAEASYSLVVYSQDDTRRWHKYDVWDKSTAEVLNDGYVDDVYYHVPITIDLSSAIIMKPGAIEADAKQEMSGIIQGTILNQDGKNMSGIYVLARRIQVDNKELISDGNDIEWFTRSDKEGKWEGELEAGKYQLVFWGGSYPSEQVIVDVYAKKETVVDNIYINTNSQTIGGNPMNICVRDVLTDKPIENASIRFRQEFNDKSGSIYYMAFMKDVFYTDAEGDLSLYGTVGQQYCIEVSAPGYRTGYFNVIATNHEDSQYCCLAPY